MNKVKLLVSAGVEFPAAVKAALGMSIREFAGKYGVPETAVSGLINGSTPYPQERVRDALAEEFDVERQWIDEQLTRSTGERAA
jgi:transcriptional regulator with XRE-family HTH domain